MKPRKAKRAKRNGHAKPRRTKHRRTKRAPRAAVVTPAPGVAFLSAIADVVEVARLRQACAKADELAALAQQTAAELRGKLRDAEARAHVARMAFSTANSAER